MNTKFTPGPWEYDGNGRVDAIAFRKVTGHILDDGVEYIGGLIALPYFCGNGTQEANARLIAASPELFEALQELTDRVERIVLADQSTPDTSRARAAIAKALGEVEQADQIEEAA